tara:strand:+ start:175 stop:711 length:537 start_codon:yes stop_codon:yes gene_type:complete
VLRWFVLLFAIVTAVMGDKPAYAQMQLSKHNNMAPIRVTSDALHIFRDKEVAVFSGNVTIVQQKLSMRSQSISIHYRENLEQDDEGSDLRRVSYVKADDGVVLSTSQETIKSDYATYDVDQGLITLVDNVVLKKAKNVVKGTKLIYNLNTGMTRLLNEVPQGSEESKPGRIKGSFSPQ